MDAMPRVSIIILNWNGWKDTIECLESVYQITYPNYDVIVVDNGSENESVEKIKEYAEGRLTVESSFFEYTTENKPLQYIEYSLEEAETGEGAEKVVGHLPSNKKLILIRNGENFGFAEGNNIGIRYAFKTINPEYVLLLNNDTVVERNFLVEMINVGLQDSRNVIIGPKILYYNYQERKDVIHSAGANIQIKLGLAPPIGVNQIDVGQFDETKHVDYVEGACMLVNKNLINQIGLLDNVFFAYWEETDWCYRASKSGLYIVYAPKAKIWHKVPERKTTRLATYLMTRNRFIFMKKNADVADRCIWCMFYVIFYFWYRLALIIFYYRNFDTLLSFLSGNRDGLIFCIRG